jgi:phosphoenolpyruvate-protein kinase (PTS system EI component)
LDEIFQIADFACIGTNDLTQFRLAVDRGAYELVELRGLLEDLPSPRGA